MGIATKVGRNAVRYRGTGSLGSRPPIALDSRASLKLARALAGKAAAAAKAKGTLSTAATGINNDFSSTWSPFAQTYSTSGSSASVSGGFGVMSLGAIGGYGAQHAMGFDPVADNYNLSVDFKVTTTTTEQFYHLWWRASSSPHPATGVGYVVEYGITGTGGQYVTAYEMTPSWEEKAGGGGLGTPLSVGDVLRVEVTASGSNHTAKWWRIGDSEPGSPQVSFSDATLTTGYIHLKSIGGDAAVARSLSYDNFVSNVSAS